MDKKNQSDEQPQDDLMPKNEKEAKEGGPVIESIAQEDPDAPRAQLDGTPVWGGRPGDPPPGQSMFPEDRPPDPGQPLPAEEHE